MYIAKDKELIVQAAETREELEEKVKYIIYDSIEEIDYKLTLHNGEFLTEEEIAQKERERLDMLTLTPSDVERALYAAKGMDFEDLKALIAEKVPTLDLKGLAIEFRAKDFWRGATLKDGTRLFDVVGALLGYTPEDMDYLFENKVLPEKSENGAGEASETSSNQPADIIEDEGVEDD